MTSGQVALNSSSATQIVAAASVNTVYVGKGTSPRTVVLLNVDASNDAYIGASTVDSTHGYKLVHGASVTLTLAAGDAIYGVSSASTPTIHYIESGI